MGRNYRYTDNNGPALFCPVCNSNWQKRGSLSVHLVCANQEILTSSELDAEGRLRDTVDNAIARGFHSQTKCASCDADLLDVVTAHMTYAPET